MPLKLASIENTGCKNPVIHNYYNYYKRMNQERDITLTLKLGFHCLYRFQELGRPCVEKSIGNIHQIYKEASVALIINVPLHFLLLAAAIFFFRFFTALGTFV